MSLLGLMKTEDWLIEYDKIILKIFKNKKTLLEADTLQELIEIKNEILDSTEKTNFQIKILNPYITDILYRICWLSLFYFNDIETINNNTVERCRNIFKKKNEDYGNAFLDFGLIGILVRMCDKINRISNLKQKNKAPEVIDENIDDTFLDLFNYSVLALCLIELC
jgi:hypothetical protein